MATFEATALQCAAGVALDLLAAIANVESGLRPFAIRDGDRITLVQSVGEGVATAVGITDQGREPSIGLMGLTPRQLRTAGMSLQDGFDACSSLKAAALVVSSAQASAVERGHGAATSERYAVRMWWRPESRFPSAATLEAAVARERAQASSLIKRDIGAVTTPTTVAARSPPSSAAVVAQRATPSAAPDCWDIFARQRAGLTQCDAPPAPATPSKPPLQTTTAPAALDQWFPHLKGPAP